MMPERVFISARDSGTFCSRDCEARWAHTSKREGRIEYLRADTTLDREALVKAVEEIAGRNPGRTHYVGCAARHDLCAVLELLSKPREGATPDQEPRGGGVG